MHSKTLLAIVREVCFQLSLSSFSEGTVLGKRNGLLLYSDILAKDYLCEQMKAVSAYKEYIMW
jgi:hypothetical protein